MSSLRSSCNTKSLLQPGPPQPGSLFFKHASTRSTLECVNVFSVIVVAKVGGHALDFGVHLCDLSGGPRSSC